MTQTITRRTVLAGTTALAALGPLPLQAAEADVEIVRLFAAYLEAERRDIEAAVAWDEARGNAIEAAEARLFGVRRKPGTEPPAARPAMSAKAWERIITAEMEAQGTIHLVQEAETAEEARDEAWEALADAPARSLVGVAVKLAAAAYWDEGLKDVWAGRYFGEKGQRLMLAARADALRLAGLAHDFGMDEPEGEYQDGDDEEEGV